MAFIQMDQVAVSDQEICQKKITNFVDDVDASIPKQPPGVDSRPRLNYGMSS